MIIHTFHKYIVKYVTFLKKSLTKIIVITKYQISYLENRPNFLAKCVGQYDGTVILLVDIVNIVEI